MSQAARIEFALHGKVEGVEISPRTRGLSKLTEYDQQVEAFIAGSQKSKLDDVYVQIVEGSYILRPAIPPVLMRSLEPDLKLMARQDVLGEMDVKRAEIVQKWQARAKSNPDLSYEVRPRKLDWKRLRPHGVERDAQGRHQDHRSGGAGRCGVRHHR